AMAKLIEAKNISKHYDSGRQLTVLNHVDISVEKGEMVSITGASGAGKSTLLHILGTLEKADTGTLLIDNQEVFKLHDKQLAQFRNLKIGFVFQFHHLLPEFTALENICIPGYIAGKPVKECIDRSMMLLDLLGLTYRGNHKPSELSGGEQQRVAVARALINNPLVVMADEPSGNLDAKNSAELHNLFVKLQKELNQTFIIVTHNNDLASMADRKLIMKDGNFIHE
ncbi:MAG: ABC transporter ATP-binding protein, partial [Bacteroidota bacterium]